MINKIKDNKSYGVLIEVGCGLPCYNMLSMQPNTASRIVKYAESPNNWEYNKTKYNHTGRAVSPDICKKFNEYHLSINDDIDFVLSNTIQVANDNITQTHGWIGLTLRNGITKFYHISIPQYEQYRSAISTYIGKACIDILASLNDTTKINSKNIDCVLNEDLTDDIIGTLNIISKHDSDGMFIYSDGKMKLVNQYIRNIDKPLIIFKGSFNPVHEHHIEMMQNTNLSGHKVLPTISLHNFDKNKQIDFNTFEKRLKLLNYFGYDVLVDNKIYFKDTISNLRHLPSVKNHKIDIMAGGDIIPKILDEFINNVYSYKYYFNNVTIYYEERSGYDLDISKYTFADLYKLGTAETNISSTHIRQNIKNSKFYDIYEKFDYINF